MCGNVRESGIEVVGNVRWGTHIGYLHSAKENFSDVLVPYIRAGLINNELCLWIYSQNTSYEEVRRVISESMMDVDTYIKSGQLIIIPYTEFYLYNNTFNEVRVNNQWRKFIRNAMDHGFDGLRAVAETHWLEKSYYRDFANYEHNVNDIISESPFIVICLYDADRLDTLEIAEIIKNHSYIITRHENQLEIIKNVELLIKDKQLEKSEDEYKRLIQLLPDSVFIHDENKIFFCNDSALRITGVKNAEDLYKKSMIEWVHPEMQYGFFEFINGMLNGFKDIDYFQSKFLSSSDGIKNVEIVSTKYSLYGRPVLISIVRDVTPFMRIHELERDIENAIQYDKMKTEFFSNVSHELKTPLSVILGIIQLAELQKDFMYDSVNRNKYFKIMKQNCYRLLRLVNNIIDLTKIDSGYYEARKQNYDIIGLVEKITMSVADYAQNKNINITFNTDTKEKIIACDPDQIERIILNLLSNAIKFTSENIWVIIHDHGDVIEIIVKDDGTGIPPGKRESIFNRFEQVDKSLKRRCEGSGIGLSLVKALVEKHNGKITLNSELGKGSEFIIEIPCNKIEEPENASEFYHDLRSDNYVEKIDLEFSDIYS